MTDPPRYADQTVGVFLDALAAAAPDPAAGSAAALTLAQAAALCAKAARLSARQLAAGPAQRLAADAERIRRAAACLIDEDADAYRQVIAATRRRPGADPGGGPAGDRAAALSRASDVPLRVVELAAQVAELAGTLATHGNPALRGDAVAAGLLAQASARSAATLLQINLVGAQADPRPARAASLLAQIGRSADALVTE